ncbi:MAG: dihydrofolate reductase [Clostridiales bacterium]|jgi:dihydrofolate reductase|nr:dihydrofolate reductase [Clostridiales bacterium]
MLSIIAAVAQNNALGKENKLLWHLSEDLKRFKAITTGAKLLMGRKTFDSLPGILPNRQHFVVTRSSGKISTDQVFWITDPLPLFEKYRDSREELFVIGGASLYGQALPFCEKLYLTIVEKDFDADTFFPNWAWAEKDWTTIEHSEPRADEKSGLQFYYLTLIKKK